ncbi:MAG: hypothetical protein ACI4IR_04260 [Eubacterium sp.]
MENILNKNRKLKILAVIELICLIFLIISVGIFLLLIIYKLYHFLFFCCIAFTLFLLFINLIQKYVSKANNIKYYTLELTDSFSYYEIKEKLEQNNKKYISNCEHICGTIVEKKRFSYRLILYRTSEFRYKKYNNSRKNMNKALNEKYQINSTDSISKISSRRKINIVFVDEINEKLEQTLNVPADRYINMSSPMLNVAVVNDKLYIPCFVGEDLFSAFLYDELIKFVFDLFLLKS